MKTLVKQKIEERAKFLLKRIKHRAIQYNNGEISFKEFIEYKNNYETQFIAYVKAFWDIELLTTKEREQIINEFSHSIVKMTYEIA